jgi:lysophospholipase L1-like esterase
VIALLGGAVVSEAAAAPSSGRTLLVLGDSYSSGEGLAPYEEGSNNCHRSSQAYGHRAAEEMTAVTVVSEACSGARIDAYLRPDDTASAPTQQARTREVDPDYIALSLGGNDAEWSALIKSCSSGLGPAFNRGLGLNDQADCRKRLDDGEETIADIAGRLRLLYEAVLTDAPRAEIKVLLYPPMFPEWTPTSGRCVIGRARPVDRLPSVDITISAEVTTRMVALQEALNAAITRTVDDLRAADPRAQARLSTVDTVAEFGGHIGHTVTCGKSERPTPWINQLIADYGAGKLSPASFHPNADGQRAMARALVGSFSVATPIPQPQQITNDQAAAIAATHRRTGYWRASADGAVTAFGDAVQHGNLRGTPLNAPVVGMVGTPSDGGYWLLAADGGVFAFGDAPFRGAATGVLPEKAVGIAAAPSGNGYWVVAANGDVRAFGDATDHGNAVDRGLLAPVVGIAATPSGGGYWLTTGDGDVLPFGDAVSFGSMAGQPLNAPAVGIAATPSGKGYWLTAADGGVFAFGDAPFKGSIAEITLQGPVVGIAPNQAGDGYWLTAEDGGVFAFGAPFLGR